jgi:hypothetical protein
LHFIAGDKSKTDSARAVRGPGLEHFHQSRKKGFAVKRKLASVLLSLVVGCLTTSAIAEDDTTAASAGSSASTSESAPTTDPSTDTATIDSSTSDGTMAASPAESDAK